MVDRSRAVRAVGDFGEANDIPHLTNYPGLFVDDIVKAAMERVDKKNKKRVAEAIWHCLTELKVG